MADQIKNEEMPATSPPDDNILPQELSENHSATDEGTLIKKDPDAKDHTPDEIKATPTSPIQEEAGPEPTKLVKKRGRPSKSSNGEDGENKRKRSKTAPKEPKTAGKPKIKTEDPKDNTSSENATRSRGRKAGTSSGSWTAEQDAYLRQLYQQTTAIKDIHERFGAKFNTGKSPNSLKLRHGKLKRDSLVLSPREEEVLKRAIHTVENNKAAAVLDIYMKEGGEGITKLTQTFVAMQLKKWGGGSKNIQSGEEVEGGDDSNDEE
ncbi:hypothetical protein TWF481_010984 [Arthrobotrys musiformis]|uniref:Myb-like domain-containing protein n=1 Tax=Arthrobotrys musiformis TaxID=47236 RepID=A0AAV9VZ33_9PEZI